ncbi:enamine deaminase RidA (YjgF/YER057c/UK114 family) [Paraburkholderia sp. HC6.4b]|nr:enamine deaminase RidA (YjgF/YER057c/UK114 family) [Paraburkholderia sp. HC6.4b]MBB5451735.1 enamine deaminase RidA (YjgF/YER057c/UK114 family) [Paraburkholderia sp. Kb1A]
MKLEGKGWCRRGDGRPARARGTHRAPERVHREHAGRHARSAVDVASLPAGVAVEVEAGVALQNV